MANEDFYVASLKRQRAHLKSVNADLAKLAENAAHLRRAGVDVDEFDEEPRVEIEAAPTDRHAAERQTADAPTAPRDAKREEKPADIDAEKSRKPHEQKTEVTGSGGMTVPKASSKNK